MLDQDGEVWSRPLDAHSANNMVEMMYSKPSKRMFPGRPYYVGTYVKQRKVKVESTGEIVEVRIDSLTPFKSTLVTKES